MSLLFPGTERGTISRNKQWIQWTQKSSGSEYKIKCIIYVSIYVFNNSTVSKKTKQNKNWVRHSTDSSSSQDNICQHSFLKEFELKHWDCPASKKQMFNSLIVNNEIRKCVWETVSWKKKSSIHQIQICIILSGWNNLTEQATHIHH